MAGLSGKMSGDAFAGMPVPQRRDSSLLCLAGENSGEFRPEFVGIASDKDVGSEPDCDWTFGVLAQG